MPQTDTIFLSPSSIANFEMCPQLYYYRNVYKNPETNLRIEVMKPSLALGQAIHSALNRFLYFSEPPRYKENLLNAFKFFWKNYEGEKGGFFSKQEEEFYKERGGMMLERFWKDAPFKDSVACKLPSFIKATLTKTLLLTGKIDWMEVEDNKVQIIDFKTGQQEQTEDSLQLPIYALIAKELFGAKEIKASYWYLDRDSEIKEFEIKDLEEIKRKIIQKGEVIRKARETNSFPCSSGFASCRYCEDYLAVVNKKAKLVNVDPVFWKRETYIIPRASREQKVEEQLARELPF